MIFLLLPAVASAAIPKSWVTGTIRDEAGELKTGQITIAPRYQSMVIDDTYISGARFSVTLTNGGFTNQLVNGDYQIVIGGANSPVIAVPGDGSTNNFVDLINTEGLLYTWRSPGAIVKLQETDPVFGFLLDKLGFNSSFSLTTNNVGTDESLTVALNVALSNLATGIGSGLTNLLHSAVTNAVVNTYQPTNANLTSVSSGGGNAANWQASGTTNSLLAGILRNHGIVATNTIQGAQYLVSGTTNQVIFGSTNTAPVSSAAPTKWISVQVTGESVVYRLPLYE